MKVALIRWLDAGAQYRLWMDGDGLDARTELHSAGVLVYENSEIVTIAADYDPESKQYRDVSTIPVSCILEKHYFDVPQGGNT